MHQRLASIFNHKNKIENIIRQVILLSYRLNLELLVTQPVLQAVKNYELNLPEICINAIVSEIERLNSIHGAVAPATASAEAEIRDLKEALYAMRYKLEKAEAAMSAPKHWLWHR
jgi:hypothetical protein